VQIGIGLGPGFIPSSGGGAAVPAFTRDYTTAALGGGDTFTRASTATFVGSNGLIQSAAANAPRFDYVGGVLRGFLIEDARTQLLLNSLIDGTILSTQSVTVTAQAYTLSFYGTGSITLSGVAVATATGTGAYPTRTKLTFTPTAGTLTLTVTGSVQFANLEAGSFPTSFIPSAGSTVTRAGDAASITGTNFSSWFNPAAGTFVVEGDASATLTSPSTLLTLMDNGGYTVNSANIGFWPSVNTLGVLTRNTTSGTVSHYTTVTGATAAKVAFGYGDGKIHVSVNNGVTTQDATALSLANVSSLLIGQYLFGNAYNGHISRIRYFPTLQSDAQIQALTA
jgi:hypothetical protein